MAPKESAHKPLCFELVTKKTKKGNLRYHARIMGGNDRIVFATQNYKEKESAKHACEIVQAEAGTAAIREVDES